MLLTLVGLMLVSGISAFVYLKAYGMTFLGQPRSIMAEHPHAPKNKHLLPLCLPAALCVIGGLGAPFIFRMIQPTISFIPVMPDSLLGIAQGVVINGTAGLLGNIACFGFFGLVLVAGAVYLRRRLLGKKEVKRGPTWGCGYQYGTPRIQYTPASFIEPAARIFGPVIGTETKARIDKSYFPQSSTFNVSAPDVVRGKFYTPLFEKILEGCNHLKWFQSGVVNTYILYIIITLVALLVWGVA